MKFIDKFLNSISMYRLMLYYLIFLVASAAILSAFGILPYDATDILRGTAHLLIVCFLTNLFFSKILKAPYNPESTLITSLILSLIMGPGYIDYRSYLLFTVAGVIAIASKYILAWKGRHIFNPAAFGAVAAALILNQGASWWVGGEWMMLPILLGGFLILRKVKRFTMVLIFTLGFLLPAITTGVGKSEYLQDILAFLTTSPILFFSFVMLIEPQTSPYKSLNQVLYGILVAVGFYMLASFGIFYPLEASLLIGNIFAYLANGSFRKILTLKSITKESGDILSFNFQNLGVKFEPGQFLEWTLAHKNPDSRGVRRFFTIASSPTEDEIILASRFADKSSSFKEALKSLRTGDQIIGSNLAGEFTLPSDASKKLAFTSERRKLCFIAGGIGITPFRSMAKYLIDKKEARDIVLLFSNKTEKDIIFRDVFEKAGWKNIYVNTDIDGYIDEELIKSKVPDYKDRHFYLSGPPSMVDAFADLLDKMGIPGNQIRTDFFPGYN